MPQHITLPGKSWFNDRRLSGIGLALALSGAFLAVTTDYEPDSPWPYLTLALGVFGISLGFFVEGANVCRILRAEVAYWRERRSS